MGGNDRSCENDVANRCACFQYYVLEKKWLDNCIHRLQFSSHYFSKTCYLKTVIEGTCSSHDQRWKPVKRFRWNLSAKKTTPS